MRLVLKCLCPGCMTQPPHLKLHIFCCLTAPCQSCLLQLHILLLVQLTAVFSKSQHAYCWLQNPVLSTVWSLSLVQILTPAYSFTVDVRAFCQSISRPEISLNAAYLIFSFLCVFVGPSWFDATNLFKFYHFRFLYSYKLDLVGWGFIVLFVAVLQITRRLWDKYEQRVTQISPVQA